MISNQMPTLSLAVLLLHCALARDSQVLRRLANTMGDNNDATTHRRLGVKAEARAYTVEHDANVELTCKIVGYKNPLVLGKYTLTSQTEFSSEYGESSDSYVEKSYSKTFTNKSTNATIRLIKKEESHSYNGHWVISDSLGLMHFYAPTSTNKPGFPPKTGWRHVRFDDDCSDCDGEGEDEDGVECETCDGTGNGSDFEGEKTTCTYLKCDKIWKKHPKCIASTKALTQLPKDSEVRKQNERVEKSMWLKGDVSERDESCEQCYECSGESPNWYFKNCDTCDNTGWI